jgi:hypothetical protein
MLTLLAESINFHRQMKQKTRLNYLNARLNIGMADVRHVYLLTPIATPMHAEVYRGRLVYWAKGSNRRISYAMLKKGLVRKTFWIIEGNVING